VATFLSPEWIDLVRVSAPSFATSVECAVTGAPAGDVRLHAGVEGIGAGSLDGAEVALTVPYADAAAIVRGELEPSVAFMQGRMKTAGDPGRLLDLLAASATPAFREALARVATDTEF